MTHNERVILLSLFVHACSGIMAYLMGTCIQQPTPLIQAQFAIILYIILSVPVDLTILLAVRQEK